MAYPASVKYLQDPNGVVPRQWINVRETGQANMLYLMGGKAYVKSKNWNCFLETLAQDLMQQVPTYWCEREIDPYNPRRFVLDLDFQNADRPEDETNIRSFIANVQAKVMRLYFPHADIQCVVLMPRSIKEIRRPMRADDPSGEQLQLFGTGVHVVWPHIHVDYQRSMQLRDHILRITIASYGPRPPPSNAWAHVIDASIYKGGLRMPGNRKASSCKHCRGGISAVDCPACWTTARVTSSGKVDEGRPYVVRMVLNEFGEAMPEAYELLTKHTLTMLQTTCVRVIDKPLTEPYRVPVGAPQPQLTEEEMDTVELRMRQMIVASQPSQSGADGEGETKTGGGGDADAGGSESTEATSASDDSGVAPICYSGHRISKLMMSRLAATRTITGRPLPEMRFKHDMETYVKQVNDKQIFYDVNSELFYQITQYLSENLLPVWAAILYTTWTSDPNRHYYIIGTDSHFCLNLNGDHYGNTIYFLIRPSGVVQKCRCTCESLTGRVGRSPPVYCSQFESEPWPLSAYMKQLLFSRETHDEWMPNGNNINGLIAGQPDEYEIEYQPQSPLPEHMQPPEYQQAEAEGRANARKSRKSRAKNAAAASSALSESAIRKQQEADEPAVEEDASDDEDRYEGRRRRGGPGRGRGRASGSFASGSFASGSFASGSFASSSASASSDPFASTTSAQPAFTSFNVATKSHGSLGTKASEFGQRRRAVRGRQAQTAKGSFGGGGAGPRVRKRRAGAAGQAAAAARGRGGGRGGRGGVRGSSASRICYYSQPDPPGSASSSRGMMRSASATDLGHRGGDEEPTAPIQCLQLPELAWL